MAKRTSSSSSVRASLVVVSAALLAGVGVGAGLSINHLRLGPWPAPQRTGAPTGAPAPAPPVQVPSVVIVENPILDAAVRRALRRIGSVEHSESQVRVGNIGRDQVSWQRRTFEVRLAISPRDATELLRAEVEGAGGHVFTATASGLQIGLFREGIPFVSNAIQFVGVPSVGRVVIIFDDAGGSLADLEPIVALGRPVTVSILPGLRYSREVAARAQAAGLEVFLHLPVEPEDSNRNLGPGGVTTVMTDQEIAATVRADLAWVPGVSGINNHMGSLGTADPRVMRAILDVAKERGLIFIDSMTTPRSVATRVAAESRVPTAARDVFLDNEDDAEAIRERFRLLIALAKRRGTAVAIGHVQRMTARILFEMLPEFDHEGIEIVPVSAVVH